MSAITDYDTLKSAVSDYLARSDLSSWIPNFIQNCESKLYRLRFRATEADLSGTIASGVLAVPSDYMALKFANVSTSPVVSLERVTPEYIYARWPVRSGSSIPTHIARQGENFIFGPSPGDYSITGIYYKKLTALSSVNTTNWFITNASDVLLYGALLEAQPFLMNDKRIMVWKDFYTEAKATMLDVDNAENRSGSNLAIKVG